MSSGPFDIKSSIAAHAILGAICKFNVIAKFSIIRVRPNQYYFQEHEAATKVFKSMHTMQGVAYSKLPY